MYIFTLSTVTLLLSNVYLNHSSKVYFKFVNYERTSLQWLQKYFPRMGVGCKSWDCIHAKKEYLKLTC